MKGLLIEAIALLWTMYDTIYEFKSEDASYFKKGIEKLEKKIKKVS